MKPMIKTLLLALLLGATPLLATASADKGTAEQAIAAAKAAQKKAASVGGEWRDIGKLIEKSEAAAEKGDFAAALKLANEAQSQGELGYAQLDGQKSLKLPSYLK